MYAEMGYDECTEKQLKFHHSINPSVVVTMSKVDGTCLHLTSGIHAVRIQKFWVLNEQRQTFAQVVRLGQNRVPHAWLLNTGSSGYDNRASNVHQLPGVAQMRVLHGLMSRPIITNSMIYPILGSQEDHMMQHAEYGNVMPSDGGEDE
jgi:hypothetical protein